MKYYKTSKFPKAIGVTGLFSIVAVCLLVLGVAGWFAFSKYGDSKTVPETKPDTSSTQSYKDPDVSYNNNSTIVESNVSSDVGKTVEDVPYEENVSSEVQSEPQPPRSFVLPIDGNISKGFSDSALQYSKTYGDMRLHKAIDIVGTKGCDVKSAGMGTVKEISDSGTLGKYIVIDHGDGITAKYCGFDGIIVNEGDSVSAGTVIGTLGSIPSECSDKSHIHVEVSLNDEIGSPLDIFGLN